MGSILLDWLLPMTLAIIAASPGLFGLWKMSRRDRADAETSYQALYEKSVKRIGELERRVEKLEKVIEHVDEILAGAHKLYHQVKALGGAPVYSPPDRRKFNLDHAEAVYGADME